LRSSVVLPKSLEAARIQQQAPQSRRPLETQFDDLALREGHEPVSRFGHCHDLELNTALHGRIPGFLHRVALIHVCDLDRFARDPSNALTRPSDLRGLGTNLKATERTSGRSATRIRILEGAFLSI
jgi:hypothetical protein